MVFYSPRDRGAILGFGPTADDKKRRKGPYVCLSVCSSVCTALCVPVYNRLLNELWKKEEKYLLRLYRFTGRNADEFSFTQNFTLSSKHLRFMTPASHHVRPSWTPLSMGNPRFIILHPYFSQYFRRSCYCSHSKLNIASLRVT